MGKWCSKRLAHFMTALLLFTLIYSVPANAGDSTVNSDQLFAHPENMVTFQLSYPPDSAPINLPITAKLICGEDLVATAELNYLAETDISLPISNLTDPICVIHLETAVQVGFMQEYSANVISSDGVLSRTRLYSTEGFAASQSFRSTEGNLMIDISVGSMPEDEVGTALKVMTFNIWQGGRLDGRHEHGWEEDNVAQLAEFIRSENPDVLFVVETYGSSAHILNALNSGQPQGRTFSGVQVTREPNQAPDRDNLWLFTWLPVEEIYPVLRDGGLTSFNFGGARLGLPDGGHIHAFSTWLHHTGGTTTELSRTAFEIALGYDRTYTNEQLLSADYVRRMEMANTLLNNRLQAYIGEDSAPVILGGDFNTQSHLDWTEQFANAPGHEGLVLEWPVMKAFSDAGFTDTYRYANPDASLYPGRTWSAAHSFTYAPSRIDYILTRGDQVRILNSSTRSLRLPEHQGTALDELYPFYSDHAAVITELLIRGEGTGPAEGPPVLDEPTVTQPAWPDPLPGSPVPVEEMTATASSIRPGSEPQHAIDEDLFTLWHSRSQPDPPDPHPHSLQIDMGRERLLTGIKYYPRIDGGYYGTITRYTLEASIDGQTYTAVASGTWERTLIPKTVELPNVTARYLRFIAHSGVGGFTSVAKFAPYEQEVTFD